MSLIFKIKKKNSSTVYSCSEPYIYENIQKINFSFIINILTILKGFMDWNEFLKLMVIIKAKSLNDKINLFIKLAD